MFSLEMLPADNGDCLWIEYGDPEKPRRVLIDGGTHATAKLLRSRIQGIKKSMGVRRVQFELLVVTHIDGDHIGGVLELLREAADEVAFRDVWFNGYHHLPTGLLDAFEAEELTAVLRERGFPWNANFGERAVVVSDAGSPPEVELEGGLRLTVVSPFRKQLRDLRRNWKKVVESAGLVPGRGQVRQRSKRRGMLGHADTWPPLIYQLARRVPRLDRSPANGASIGIIADYRGGRCLLGADCFPSVLEKTLNHMKLQRGRLPLAAFKVPHHGSARNLTDALLERLQCSRYLISTNGKHHRHPDHEALARILVHGGSEPELGFNYQAPTTNPWRQPPADAPPYRTRYPLTGQAGLSTVILK